MLGRGGRAVRLTTYLRPQAVWSGVERTKAEE